ncbi:MAG: hypothetical protein MRY76_11545 [Pseudomonadales bacterium]|nr:hypothetical protein [Pseudomonadales bacterium]
MFFHLPKAGNQQLAKRKLALLAVPFLLLISQGVSAQALTITVPEINVAEVTGTSRALDANAKDDFFTPYSSQHYQPLLSRGLQLQEVGQHQAALDLLNQAWQINRINYGLYNESQIPVLKSLVFSGIETEDWQTVDQLYDYMTHLYLQIYELDDPRLDEGLEKISSYHITAFNADLGEGREYHLRKAAELLELRLETSEQTLATDHPRLAYLNESITTSRKHLFLLSDRYREMMRQQGKASRDRLLADLD